MPRWSAPRGCKLFAGLVAVAAACSVGGTAVSASASSATTTRAGTMACSQVTGRITFSPPLRSHLRAGTTMRVTRRLASAGCVSSVSSVHMGPVSRTSTTLQGPSHCAELLTDTVQVDTSWTTRWASPSTQPTWSRFTGIDGATDEAGDQGWTMPGSDGTAGGSGSYTGADAGTTSTVAFASASTPTQLLAACSSARGLGSIELVSGRAYFG